MSLSSGSVAGVGGGKVLLLYGDTVEEVHVFECSRAWRGVSVRFLGSRSFFNVESKMTDSFVVYSEWAAVKKEVFVLG